MKVLWVCMARIGSVCTTALYMLANLTEWVWLLEACQWSGSAARGELK